MFDNSPMPSFDGGSEISLPTPVCPLKSLDLSEPGATLTLPELAALIEEKMAALAVFAEDNFGSESYRGLGYSLDLKADTEERPINVAVSGTAALSGDGSLEGSSAILLDQISTCFNHFGAQIQDTGCETFNAELVIELKLFGDVVQTPVSELNPMLGEVLRQLGKTFPDLSFGSDLRQELPESFEDNSDYQSE